MRSRFSRGVGYALTALAAIPLFTSCATMQEHPKLSSLITAAGTGGATFLACKAAGGSDADCALASVLAAVAAGSITYVALQKISERDTVVRELGYQERQGRVASIDDVTVEPSVCPQGTELQLASRWAVVGPDPNEQFPYAEKWEIRKVGGQTSQKLKENTDKTEQGRFRSAITFKLPNNLPPGAYQVSYSLAVAEKKLSAERQFEVVEKRMSDGRVIRQVVLGPRQGFWVE
jgi:hypothetical protein